MIKENVFLQKHKIKIQKVLDKFFYLIKDILFIDASGEFENSRKI